MVHLFGRTTKVQGTLYYDDWLAMTYAKIIVTYFSGRLKTCFSEVSR